jgi:acetolactate synthase-1/3 small subunit
MLNTLVIYVDNKPGVLNRVASLFRRRALNIESVTVGHTEKSGVSRITITVDIPEGAEERIAAYIYKLVPVICVENITRVASVARELALLKIRATHGTRPRILELVRVFRARVVDVGTDSLIAEATGTEDKIDGLLEVLRPFGIVEMVRTGRAAMARGTATSASQGAPPQAAGWTEELEANSKQADAFSA